ncbi:MAG: hypothetical protein II273_00370, partial [Lachnospiraceae bacterium]|nr:hypothetical protein [Lachnospiraceae bacterium]
KSNMPNAPFRKYQTSGFAFEAYSFAIHNAEKGVLTTLNNTQLNLNLRIIYNFNIVFLVLTCYDKGEEIIV